jgi:hypothetical protein
MSEWGKSSYFTVGELTLALRAYDPDTWVIVPSDAVGWYAANELAPGWFTPSESDSSHTSIVIGDWGDDPERPGAVRGVYID